MDHKSAGHQCVKSVYLYGIPETKLVTLVYVDKVVDSPESVEVAEQIPSPSPISI